MTTGTFFIRNVIIHDVPKSPKGSDSEPILSEAPSLLDDRNRNHFRERIARTLSDAAFPIEYDPNLRSPVPGLIVDYFTSTPNEDRFVRLSRDMANHLHSLHTGATSAGLLAVIEAVDPSGEGGARRLVLLKLEKEAGIEVTQTKTPDGRATFAVEVLETTLNERTRVFKAAIFSPALQLAEIAGRASDNQRTGQFGDEISDFFLKFLGCRHRTDPARSTANFVDRLQTLLNNRVSADRRIPVQTALLAELASEERFISPTDFADRYLEPGVRDEFLEPFHASDGSISSFEKDNSLVDEALAKIVYFFENGLILTGSPDAMQQVEYSDSLGAWIIPSERTRVEAKPILKRARK